MADLKPCERCGQPPAYDHTSADGVRFTCLACDDATFEDFDQAAEFWNRRPTPPPVPAVTPEELVEIIQRSIPIGQRPLTCDFEAAADDILSRLAAGQPPEHN